MFYRIPKVLFTKEYFSGLSTDAKVLYGLMLDQMSMSRENRWHDNDNRVFIFFSVQRACAYLGYKKDKALKLFVELDSETGIGLIRIIAPGAIGYKNCECVQRPNNGQMEALDVVKQVMESI